MAPGITAPIIGGTALAGGMFGLGYVSNLASEGRANDGFSLRDAAISGGVTAGFGVVGLGMGSLLPSTMAARGASMSMPVALAVGGIAAAAIGAAYMTGWSLSN